MASSIPESTIEEIKVRTDLADLISSYGVQVRHAGTSLKACCPFHHEKTPSFVINPTKGFYHCFGCGESGDAIKFVMKMDGSTFVEAARKLADQCGVKIETKEDPEAGRRKRLYALMAELAAFYHRCLQQTKEAQLARDYLAKRDLPVAVQEDFVIGYAPNGISTILKWAEKYGYTPDELDAAGVIKPPTCPGDKGYHRFGGRLMFSIKDKQGRVVAFSGRQLIEKKNSGKYVNSPETPIFKKSHVLFGFDRAAGAITKSPTREVICCEGQIDTIRLHISGFPTAVASQGTAFTEEHAKMIHRVADSAVLMYDDDAAGRKATIKVARMLLAREMPVRVVSLPGGDDPDSFLRRDGAEALKALIDQAESIVAFQCRAERAKEANPHSIDAVSRISKAVLETMAACPSAILRATMVAEAAKLLALPVAALTDELARTKAPPPPAPQEDAISTGGDETEFIPPLDSDESYAGDEQHDNDEPILGDTPARVTPPPAREVALMEFLMAHENDQSIDAMLGEFLPLEVFSHDFTVRFCAVWRDQLVSGEDRFGAFADALETVSRGWFDNILLNAGKVQSSNLSVTDVMKEFIRSLWCDELARRRGALPAASDAETDAQRMKLSLDLKRLQQVKWNTVKDIIRDFKKGDN